MEYHEYITDFDTRGMDDLDLWYHGPGWYFLDETANFVGPYETYVDSVMAQTKHEREEG